MTREQLKESETNTPILEKFIAKRQVALCYLPIGIVREQIETIWDKKYKGRQPSKPYAVYSYENRGIIIDLECVYRGKDSQSETCACYKARIYDIADLPKSSLLLAPLYVIEKTLFFSGSDRIIKEKLTQAYNELVAVYSDFVETGLKKRYQEQNKTPDLGSVKDYMNSHIQELNNIPLTRKLMDFGMRFVTTCSIRESYQLEDETDAHKQNLNYIKVKRDIFGFPANAGLLDDSYLTIPDDKITKPLTDSKEFQVFCHLNSVNLKEDQGSGGKYSKLK